MDRNFTFQLQWVCTVEIAAHYCHLFVNLTITDNYYNNNINTEETGSILVTVCAGDTDREMTVSDATDDDDDTDLDVTEVDQWESIIGDDDYRGGPPGPPADGCGGGGGTRGEGDPPTDDCDPPAPVRLLGKLGLSSNLS